MVFDENASVGTDAGENISQMPPVTDFNLPGLDGVERLVVPSEPSTRSFIPFGIDGVTVIISPYGEVLRMSKYIAEDNPRVICLDSPVINGGRRFLNGLGAGMQRRALERNSGLGIDFMADSIVEDPIKTRLEWINGRWPCIQYEIDGFLISVLFTVNEGVLSQQFFIENPSSESKAVRFALQVQNAIIRTLRVAHGRWTPSDASYDPDESVPPLQPNASGLYNIVEREHKTTQNYGDAVPDGVKGEAVFAVIHNGKSLVLDRTASVPISLPWDPDSGRNPDDDVKSKSDQTVPSASSGFLQVAPQAVQKLVVQYKLQSHDIEQPWSLQSLNVETFLKSDQSRSWSFKKDHEFNSIFRRYLEHILCLCLVDVMPDPGKERRVPFMNDITFESASTPLGDFYIFRYLLFMYQLLKTDDFVSVSTNRLYANGDGDTSTYGKAELQARIEAACTGHLRWCFEESVFLARQSWPASPRTGSDVNEEDDKPSAGFLIGSLQMLKLFEFSKVIEGEAKLVKECLQVGAKLWLDALDVERDEKSGLWYKDTRKTYIAWGGRGDEGSEWLYFPDYRLGDLIYTWKALKSLEIMSCQFKSKDDEDISPDVITRLEDLKLRAHNVRRTILQRFAYQPQSSRSVMSKSAVERSDQRHPEQAVPKKESAPTSFAIAVRRSRERDRLLFYAKDAMLHDGIEWAFFTSDIKIEAYSAKNEPTEVNVQRSWQNTMRAQGIDHETTWKKPIRYALAIIMASHRISLDNSKTPDKLAEISWERLPRCVMSHGLFPNQLDRDTKLPQRVTYWNRSERPHSPWATWELATLLLGRRFRNLELEILGDAPLPHARVEYVSQGRDEDAKLEIADRGTTDLQPPDGSTSEITRSAMMKRVALEKRRTSSNKKVDLKLVSDFKERRAKEWLYPYPDFITKKPPYDRIREDFDITGLTRDIGLENDLSDSLRSGIDWILRKGFEKWSQEKEFSAGNYSAIVVDVGVNKRSDPDAEWCDAEDLDRHVRQARSIDDAKKRFHFLAPLEAEHALILFLATPKKERLHMARFYVRHSNYSSHLHEDIHPLADVWATELHLSFFQMVKLDERPPTYVQEDSRNEENPENRAKSDDVCEIYQRAFPSILGSSRRAVLEKASLSYRFVGDMADKFWTGYLLANLPADSEILRKPKFYGSYDIEEWFHEDRKLNQRKILEPFLVEKMVAVLLKNTNRILRTIDDWLNPEIDVSEDDKSVTQPKVSKADDRFVDVQYNRSAICLDLDATLRILRHLSKANVDSLGQWVNREKVRSFQPRWSEKDEFKYRELIDFQKRRAEQQISRVNDQYRRIQNSIEQVRTHRQELINNINLAESRSAAHESENIRIFTYATVIFYPLSFVASLFSIQGPPNHATTPIFLQATAIALVTTLLMVFNAETLAWPIRGLRYIITNSAREKMGRTPNRFPVSWEKTLDHIKDAEEHDILHDHEMPKWPRSKLLYLAFLVVYFFIDFPASRIVLAYESMMDFETKSPDRATLAIVRMLVALVFLPVFVASWTILAIWSLLRWTLTKVWTLPLNEWKKVQQQSSDRHVDRLRKQYEAEANAEAEAKAAAEAKEKAKEQDGARDEDRESLHSAARGEKNNKKEKAKTVEERIDETRRNQRKEKDDRIRDHVKLLINPPDLYERMEANALRLRKKKQQREQGDASSSRSSRRVSATEVFQGENGAVPAARNHSPKRRSVWHHIFGRPERKSDDEILVEGRDK